MTGLETRPTYPSYVPVVCIFLPYLLKRPAEVLPFGINPQLARFSRQIRNLWIASDVLYRIPQMLFIANDSIVAFVLP